jgi:hypothetical protein
MSLPPTPWQHAIETSAEPAFPYSPQEPHVDLSTLEALRETKFRLALAVKQLGHGGLVITPEDRTKPAPMIHEKREGGNVRYVTYQNGS